MTNIGSVGTEYVNRKTGRSGVFVAQDDDNKLVELESDGSIFTVPYKTFKSSWRVLTIAELGDTSAAVDEVAEVVCDTPCESDAITSADSDNCSVDDIITYIKNTAGARVDTEQTNTQSNTTITMHGVVVCAFEYSDDESCIVHMLPDVYTGSHLVCAEFCHAMIERIDNKYYVRCECKASYSYIMQIIKDQIVGVNLYGYIEE